MTTSAAARPELAGWLKVVVFATTLLSVTWLMMWMAASAK
jgi:hypothetical protein